MYGSTIEYEDPMGLRLNNYNASYPISDNNPNPEALDTLVDCNDENENPYLWWYEKLTY